MSIPPQDEPSINRSVDVPSTSDCRLIELENQVQRLMEAHLAPKQSIQVNKINSSCEIYSGLHDTQYCMENPEQAFVDYASLRTDEAGGKWFTFKPEKNNLGDTYNLSWKSHPNLSSINAITICPKQPNKYRDDKSNEEEEEKANPKTSTPPHPYHLIHQSHSSERKFVNSIRSLSPSAWFPRSSDTKFVCTKEDDGDEMFIEIIKKYDDSHKEELEVEVNAMTKGLGVEYFDTFTTRSELAYHKRRKVKPREDPNRGVSNFTGRIKGVHVFLGNFTYVVDFMIVEDISSIIDPRLSQVVLGKPFIEISNMTHDLSLGVVKFTDGINEIAYKMPHKIEEYDSLSDLEKKHTKSVYLRNEEEKRRGVYILQEVTNIIACGNFLLENKCEIFTEDGDGVRIIPDGVSTWMAFGGNTRDLAHLEKKRTRLRLYTKSLEETIIQTVETTSSTLATAASGISQRRQNVAASKEILETSSKRRRQELFCDAVAV
ncbi:hypothetical protein Tco_0983277 [Tanacetum coccineum]